LSKENKKSSPVSLSEEEQLEIKNTRKYMLDLLVISVAPAVMACYYHGLRALLLIALGIVSAAVCEKAAAKLYKMKSYLTDLSAVTLGMVIALCLSASSPWWLVVTAVSFAVFAVKMPFGGNVNSMFSPVAAAVAFVSICCREVMFSYPAVGAGLKTAVFGSEDYVAGESVADMLLKGNSIGNSIINYIDILIGNVPGPMGAVCVLALLGGLIYLVIRRPKTAVISLCYFASCAAVALIFPRVTTGRLISVFMELSSGLLFIGGLVMLSNERIAPEKLSARILYGICAGLAVMTVRHISSFEDSTAFVILIMNSAAPLFDKIPKMKLGKKKNEKIEIEIIRDTSTENGGAVNG